jgi:hypothetical protein
MSIDRAVYKHPALCARSRLRKVRHRVEPLIPPAQHGLRERSINVREVLDGSFNVVWTGRCRMDRMM